jgi:hypothetical protein
MRAKHVVMGSKIAITTKNIGAPPLTTINTIAGHRGGQYVSGPVP